MEGLKHVQRLLMLGRPPALLLPQMPRQHSMLCTSEGLHSVEGLQRVQRLLMLGRPPALLYPQLLLRSLVELAAAVNTNQLSDCYA